MCITVYIYVLAEDQLPGSATASAVQHTGSILCSITAYFRGHSPVLQSFPAVLGAGFIGFGNLM